MTKLFTVLISSLSLFQSRLPLIFNEFIPNPCDLAGGSSQSILILKSYSTTFLVKRSHINGGFNWFIVLYISTISFFLIFPVNCQGSIFCKSASSAVWDPKWGRSVIWETLSVVLEIQVCRTLSHFHVLLISLNFCALVYTVNPRISPLGAYLLLGFCMGAYLLFGFLCGRLFWGRG